jgi:hypothetical protein
MKNRMTMEKRILRLRSSVSTDEEKLKAFGLLL